MTTEKKKKKPKRGLPNTVAVLIWNVPIDVRQRFKAYCAQQDKTMGEMLIKHMETLGR